MSVSCYSRKFDMNTRHLSASSVVLACIQLQKRTLYALPVEQHSLSVPWINTYCVMLLSLAILSTTNYIMCSYLCLPLRCPLSLPLPSLPPSPSLSPSLSLYLSLPPSLPPLSLSLPPSISLSLSLLFSLHPLNRAFVFTLYLSPLAFSHFSPSAVPTHTLSVYPCISLPLTLSISLYSPLLPLSLSLSFSYLFRSHL